MLISPFFWLLAGLSGHSAANRRLTGKRLKSQGAKLSFSSVSVRWGRAGAFTRWVFFRPQGTGDGLSLSRRKQKPRVGTHSEPAACVRDWAKPQTRCVNCSPQVGRTFSSYLSPFSVWLLPLNFLFICRSGRDGPLLSSEKKVDKDSQKGFAPLNPIPVP